jgi:hypothetical protein
LPTTFFHFRFFGSFSFRFAYFASLIFVSLTISSFSLQSETSEKTAFFCFEAKSFLLHFRFILLQTKNERRTLIPTCWLISWRHQKLAAVAVESRGAGHNAAPELYVLGACLTVEGSVKRTNKTTAWVKFFTHFKMKAIIPL